MHIEKITIRNIRPIKEFVWNPQINSLSGWHVILGNNGSGKSSIIKAIALGLIGPNDSEFLREDWPSWIKSGEKKLDIFIRLKQHIDYDKISESGLLPHNHQFYCAVSIRKIAKRIPKPSEEEVPEIEQLVEPTPIQNVLIGKKSVRNLIYGHRHVWGNGIGKGWFSTSFGPFRRFSGGDPNLRNAYDKNPKAAPHISAFSEKTDLEGTLDWIKNIAKTYNRDNIKILKLITDIVNSDSYLPDKIKLHSIKREEIKFINNYGNTFTIDLLSDGYRSALSIILEIIRQLILAFGIEKILKDMKNDILYIPGVIQIDEVDAHLHPTWQQHIGFWLTKRFPEMQFIVTTHSPLICQAATTVYKLPTPGTDEEGRFLDDLELSRLRYGNIFEAYASEAFGKIDRSEEGKVKLERLADLTRLSWERELTEEEQREQAQLRAIFIDSPIGI